MPQPTLPPEVEAALATMQKDMVAALAGIRAEIDMLEKRWYYESIPSRLKRLYALESQVPALSRQITSIVNSQAPGIITSAYEIGAFGVGVQVGSATTFTAVDLNAMAVLAGDTMSDLLTKTPYIADNVKTLTRVLTRDHLRDALITGTTAEREGVLLAADLAETLAKHRVDVVTYANGGRVSIASYSDMVMRTKTAVAYQEGGFQQGKALGIEWYEIMDGPDCGLSYHDDPTLADGLIVRVDVAERFPISHPNCVRVSSPRPDITSTAEAKDAKRTSPEEQVANQAAASRARAEYIARRPRRISLEAAVNRELSLRGSSVSLPPTLTRAQQRFLTRSGAS